MQRQVKERRYRGLACCDVRRRCVVGACLRDDATCGVAVTGRTESETRGKERRRSSGCTCHRGFDVRTGLPGGVRWVKLVTGGWASQEQTRRLEGEGSRFGHYWALHPVRRQSRAPHRRRQCGAQPIALRVALHRGEDRWSALGCAVCVTCSDSPCMQRRSGRRVCIGHD